MNRERRGQAFTRWANWLDELIWRLDGYAVIPHELLHALAYRIVQKPYHYRLGNHIVSPLSERTLGEKIFIKLFPFAVTGCFTIATFGLWLATLQPGPFTLANYLAAGPRWHMGLMLLNIILQIYTATSFRDIQTVIELLAERRRKSR